jgi:hypothetical protein
MGRGRPSGGGATTSPEQKAELVERFRKFREQPTLSGSRLDTEDDMVTVQRSVHLRRGSWWQLPKNYKEAS